MRVTHNQGALKSIISYSTINYKTLKVSSHFLFSDYNNIKPYSNNFNLRIRNKKLIHCV